MISTLKSVRSSGRAVRVLIQRLRTTEVTGADVQQGETNLSLEETRLII